jgi:hypothetical protein
MRASPLLLLLLLTVLFCPGFGRSASQTLSPTAASEEGSGDIGTGWIPPSNAAGAWADTFVAHGFSNTLTTQWRSARLVLHGFGFSVPNGATNIALQVTVYAGDFTDLTCSFVEMGVRRSPLVWSGNLLSSIIYAQTTTGFRNYSSPSRTLNSVFGTAVTPSEVRTNEFGVFLVVGSTTATDVCSDTHIDSVRVRVTYDPPGTTGVPTTGIPTTGIPTTATTAAVLTTAVPPTSTGVPTTTGVVSGTTTNAPATTGVRSSTTGVPSSSTTTTGRGPNGGGSTTASVTDQSDKAQSEDGTLLAVLLILVLVLCCVVVAVAALFLLYRRRDDKEASLPGETSETDDVEAAPETPTPEPAPAPPMSRPEPSVSVTEGQKGLTLPRGFTPSDGNYAMTPSMGRSALPSSDSYGRTPVVGSMAEYGLTPAVQSPGIATPNNTYGHTPDIPGGAEVTDTSST